jgi:hypothetical protein
MKTYVLDTVKYLFIILAMPYDDGQQWPKHVKAIICVLTVNFSTGWMG